MLSPCAKLAIRSAKREKPIALVTEYRVTPRRAIALRSARRISSNTAQRTSIRFGSYTWNMQGGLLP